MAKRRTEKREKHGWGAKFLNPQYKAPNKDEKKVIAEHGEPFDNRKWITTGVHASREAGLAYVLKTYPYIKPENIRTYGIRTPKYFFSEETEALLARMNAKGFGAAKE